MEYNELEPSFEEKLSEVTNLALQIDNFLYTNNLYEFFEQDLVEKVDGYARGLKQERIIKNIEGRVSLRQLIEFDIAKEEQKIDDDIILFKETLKNLM